MKKKERETLSQQSDADLAEKEKQLTEAQWKLRLQKATGQLEDPSRLRVLRRDLARIKTYRRAHALKAEAGQ
jgi:large subunit ribosomal protein L29